MSIESIYGQYEQKIQADAYKANDTMDKNAFLHLMTAQLRYQDPLDPMDNQEFVAQMAQFTSLEQMQNLNTQFEELSRLQSIGQTSSLIGKQVTVLIPESGEAVKGTVRSAVMVDGEYYVNIEGVNVPVENIIQIEPAASQTSQE